jgi:catechol 2,3-dioxygenase-like lactoylglutathione lyase family enzyme
MQIKLASVMVDDQDKALRFYTGVLGLVIATDLSIGPLRWLTVASPDGIEGVELVLELTDFPASQVYQKARFAAGIPALALFTADIAAEHRRLLAAGVTVHGEPQTLGPILSVVFEDGCGNLVHLVQPVA